MRFAMISGMGRSGGSLLARLLDGHPEIASFPYEPRFGKIEPHKHNKLSERFPDPLTGSIEDVLRRNRRLEHCLSIVSGARPSKNEFPDYDLEFFRKALRCPLPEEAKPGDFIEAYAEAFFRSHAYYRNRWNDISVVAWHSARSQFWSEDLLNIEGLQLIYIVRHPLDVLASYMRSKGRKVPITPEIELLCWCDCILRAARDQECHPDRVTMVRYEDMVSDVDAFAHKLARRLGIADTGELRHPSLLGEAWTGNSSYQKYNAVSRDSIGRFANFFSADQISRCAEVLDGWLGPLGYSLEGPYFSEPVSLERIAAEKDPFALTRDLLLYTESRFKRGLRDGDHEGFWPNPYAERQKAGISTAIKKKARSLFAAADPKGQKT